MRSEKSLIQTIGRAARHINGRAILYGDKVTGSMDRAISETNRRRDRQLSYNKEHKIIPKGVTKSVQDILEGARRMPTRGRSSSSLKNNKVALDSAEDYSVLTPAALSKQLKLLEEKMHEHAKNLEFEEAAALRDKVTDIKQKAFVA